MITKLAIASDHAGYDLKEAVKHNFSGIEWVDLGTDSTESVDYPDYGKAMGEAMMDARAEFGILICGSGIGISIAANRCASVRAALCTSKRMAELARLHNDANVLAIGARVVDEMTAFEMIEAFINTKFEGGRHQNRVSKLG